VPALPRCTTPHIRLFFIAPQFRIGLPSDPPHDDALALLIAFGFADLTSGLTPMK